MKHEGLIRVRNAIGEAALAAGREPDTIALVAVSKTFAAPDIIPVLNAGQRIFGENRVQEAKTKWQPLRAQWSDIELHLIGPLQTNKVADAVALFDCIQSVDRPKLARALADEMHRQKRTPRLFVQVNIGREPQKAGIDPDSADQFLNDCKHELGLTISGLMCIPPAGVDPRPYFDRLADIAARNAIAGLSMGMSADFETAIAAGATIVRVGSAIFGWRAPASPSPGI